MSRPQHNFPAPAARPALILLILLLSQLPSAGQKGYKLFNNNLYIEGKVYYGFLYAQHLELERFNAHFPAFEINLQQHTYGKHKWERNFDYPIIGMALLYSPVGNSPEIGQAFALMPFINFPLVRHKGFMLGFRFALGAGYLTNRFDRISNYKNLAIGSHLNAAVNLQFEARYRFNSWLTASAGVCLQHFSNGSLKLPNYGLNAPMVNLGLAFKPLRENRYITDHNYPPTEPYSAIVTHGIEFYLGAALGYKNMEQVLGQNYLVYHLYENTFYQVSRKSKWGIGFDASYDPSQIRILELEGDSVSSNWQVVRPGVNIAYELMLSRLGFILNLGYYLGGKEKSNGPLYEKLSFQYDFSKNFFANVMLKVHFGRADYIGWGVGYKFSVRIGSKNRKK